MCSPLASVAVAFYSHVNFWHTCVHLSFLPINISDRFNWQRSNCVEPMSARIIRSLMLPSADTVDDVAKTVAILGSHIMSSNARKTILFFYKKSEKKEEIDETLATIRCFRSEKIMFLYFWQRALRSHCWNLLTCYDYLPPPPLLIFLPLFSFPPLFSSLLRATKAHH